MKRGQNKININCKIKKKDFKQRVNKSNTNLFG